MSCLELLEDESVETRVCGCKALACLKVSLFIWTVWIFFLSVAIRGKTAVSGQILIVLQILTRFAESSLVLGIILKAFIDDARQGFSDFFATSDL